MLDGRSTGQTATTFVKRDSGRRRARRSPQREIAAERVPDDERALSRMPRRDLGQCTDDLVDATRVEQLPIQRERLAVIAEVEPEHVKARVVEHAANGQDVAGSALPSQPCSIMTRPRRERELCG